MYKTVKFKITLLNDINIQKFLRELVEKLHGFLRVSVDCWVSTVSYRDQIDKDGNKIIVPKFGIVYPNFWGSINTTEMLRTPQDLEDMIDQLDPTLIKDRVLKNTFAASEGVGSGVNVHRILAYEVLVNCYPPGFILR